MDDSSKNVDAAWCAAFPASAAIIIDQLRSEVVQLEGERDKLINELIGMHRALREFTAAAQSVAVQLEAAHAILKAKG